MKFLHSGDWHLGKSLRALSRRDECEQALNEMLDIARREAVDCLLVAGDTFDTTTPSPEAEALLFDFLRELFGAGIPAVIIGGNHDHPKRLAAVSRVLELLNVHLRAEAVLPESGGLVRVASRDGSEAATIAVLPWVHERHVVQWQSLMEQTSHQEYAEQVAKMASLLAGAFPRDTVNVLLAHLMVDGAQVGGGERELHLGAVYAVKPQALPGNASYIALGHVHRPQAIDAPSPARYAGSLLQLDFGERGQEKSVALVEAHPGRPARVETIPLSAGRRLRDLEGKLGELQALAADAGDDYLRVRVHVDGPIPGLTRQVRELLPNALDVVPVYPDRERTESDQRLRTLSPDQLLAEYHQATYGSAVPAPVLDLFRRLQEEVDRAAP
ncbi:MAG: exonuclease SbcCD subunit D [Dehalococcoidia bacterium]|nr:exonuclease SbcCD subunit D [Dehalococcoidia bacterium]